MNIPEGQTRAAIMFSEICFELCEVVNTPFSAANCTDVTSCNCVASSSIGYSAELGSCKAAMIGPSTSTHN